MTVRVESCEKNNKFPAKEVSAGQVLKLIDHPDEKNGAELLVLALSCNMFDAIYNDYSFEAVVLVDSDTREQAEKYQLGSKGKFSMSRFYHYKGHITLDID